MLLRLLQRQTGSDRDLAIAAEELTDDLVFHDIVLCTPRAV